MIVDKEAVQAPWLTVPPPQKFFYPCHTVDPDLSKANLVSKVVVYKLAERLKVKPILQVDTVFEVILQGNVIFNHLHSLQFKLLNSK